MPPAFRQRNEMTNSEINFEFIRLCCITVGPLEHSFGAKSMEIASRSRLSSGGVGECDTGHMQVAVIHRLLFLPRDDIRAVLEFVDELIAYRWFDGEAAVRSADAPRLADEIFGYVIGPVQDDRPLVGV